MVVVLLAATCGTLPPSDVPPAVLNVIVPAPVSVKPEPSKSAAAELDADALEALAAEALAALDEAALDAEPPQPARANAMQAAAAMITTFLILSPFF